ncbi:uncharacterized protein LOC144448099 [Glandiceps talaboti]
MFPAIWQLCWIFILYQTTRVRCSECIAVCEECQPAPLDCLGQRLRLGGCGCCTVCAGQVDDYCDELILPCDTDFGLSCHEHICKGAHNLHVKSESPGSLLIEWDPFLQGDQDGHYIVFYTSQYSDNVLLWTASESGDTTHELERLEDNLDYFIRVTSVSTDDVPAENSIFTETLVYKTSAQGSWCQFNSTNFKHGDSFNKECEVCTCHTGEWSCVAKPCPPPDDVIVINPTNCHPVPHPDEPECCQVIVCEQCCDEPHGERSCWHGDIEYHHGEHYNHGCDQICNCYDGAELCISRCEDPGELKPDETTCPYPVLVPPSEGECCYSWTCLAQRASCEMNGNVYEDGERFDVDCNAICRCDGSRGHVACVSMCPPSIMLPSPDCPLPTLVDVPGECCQQWECKNVTCELNGVIVNEGEWIDEDCQGRCQCNAGELFCIATTCPRLVIVLPPITGDGIQPLCPEPFFGKRNEDDCCDELYCHHPNRDSPNQVRSVLAESFGPSSLVISFLPPTNQNLLALVDSYEIYYTDDRNVTGVNQWRLQSVTTPSPFSENRQKRDTLTGFRIVTEIKNLLENTIYFVMIRVGILDSGGVSLPGTLPFSDIIVTKTDVSTGRPCQFEGKTLQNGEEVQDGCSQSCRCDLGILVCKPLCQIYPLLPSEECPVPKLVSVDGECCQQWRCFANDNDCRHNNRTYIDGEEWREGCDQRCYCRGGAVTCQHLCSRNSTPPSNCPHAALVNVPGTCCQQWICHEGLEPTITPPISQVLPPLSLLSMNITRCDVTTTMAVIRWSPLTDIQRQYITGIVVKYKDLLLASEWTESKEIYPSARNFTLIGLQPGRTYLTQLVVLIEKSKLGVHLDSNIVTIHTKKEGSPSAVPFLMPVTIEVMSISENSVKLKWPQLSGEIITYMRTLNLVYNDTSDQRTFKKMAVPFNTNTAEISDLESEHTYSVLLLGIWGNGTVLREIKSNVATVTTLQVKALKEHTPTKKYTILGGCIAAVVLLLLLVFLLLYIRRKNKTNNTNNQIDSIVAFENKKCDGETETGAL